MLRDLPVTVVLVWADPVAFGYGMGMAVVTDLERFRRAADDTARDVLRKAGGPTGGPPTTAVALQGRTSEVLTRASQGADMLAVGTRSAGALSRGVLGSVSASALHHAHCPVVVVPEPHDHPTDTG